MTDQPTERQSVCLRARTTAEERAAMCDAAEAVMAEADRAGLPFPSIEEYVNWTVHECDVLLGQERCPHCGERLPGKPHPTEGETR